MAARCRGVPPSCQLDSSHSFCLNSSLISLPPALVFGMTTAEIRSSSTDLHSKTPNFYLALKSNHPHTHLAVFGPLVVLLRTFHHLGVTFSTSSHHFNFASFKAQSLSLSPSEIERVPLSRTRSVLFITARLARSRPPFHPPR